MKNMDIQSYLSLGYIYLLVTGLITDLVYYNRHFPACFSKEAFIKN